MRRGLGGATVLVAIAGLAALFALPYRDAASRPRPPVESLLGRLDGSGRLTKVSEVDGSVTWTSSTSVAVPASAITAMPADVSDSIAQRLGGPAGRELAEHGRLVGARAYREEVVDRGPDGSTSLRSSITLLDDEGFALVAAVDAAQGTQVYDPPLAILPRDPAVGSSWTSTGSFGTSRYRLQAEVASGDRRQLDIGVARSCLLVTSTLSLTPDDGEPYVQHGREWWCDGLGSMEYSVEVPDGRKRATVVAADGLAPSDRPPVAPAPDRFAPPELGADGWERTTVSASLSGVVTASPSALPVVVEGSRPTVLVATEASETLQAFDPEVAEGSVRGWTAAMGSIAFGSPLVDAGGGRVFAGSASGEVRAFTTEGLFLWATDVGDNVATRPALADGVLVIGSEDGHVVGLDAASGKVRWRVETGGPVVSWPAVAGDRVVVGSDDGIVRSIDPRSGSIGWTYDVGSPVVGPITSVGADVLAPGRSGDLVRLRRDGSEAWTAETGGTLERGAVRVGEQAVVVAGGEVVAIDLANGGEAWRHGHDVVGPVAAIDGRASILAARADGTLVALDRTGQTAATWKPLADVGGFGSQPGITVGPVAGGGAIWVVDGSGRLQRLGPKRAGRAAERAPAWAFAAGVPPLSGSLLETTPVVDGDRTYLLGGSGEIVQIDPATGDAVGSASIEVEDLTVRVPAVAHDGVGYLAAQSGVLAFELPGGEVRWRAEVPGSVLRAPVVADGRVLVASEDDADHHLSAFDAASGRLLWHEAVGRARVSGAMLAPLVVVDDVVVTGDPIRGLHVDDGSEAWTSGEATGSLGGGALLPSGEVAVTVTDATDPGDGVRSSVIALDPTTGARVHRVDLSGVLPEGLVDLVVAGDLVVLQDGGRRRLVAVDPLEGTGAAWAVDLPTERLGGIARLDDGLLWTALVDGRVVALDPRTGSVAVTTAELGIDLTEGGIAQHPIEVDGTVVVAAGLVALGISAGAP